MSDSTISGSDAIEPSPQLYNEDLKPLEDWSAFSWFVGVLIAAVVYYAISARDFRQPELEDGNAHDATTTRPQEAQA